MKPRFIYIFLLGVLFASCGVKSSRALHTPQSSNISAQRAKIVQVARAKVGAKYKMGATGPKKFDCSGFTQYVFREAGVSIPRTAKAQSQLGKEVRLDKVKEGDLVVFKKGRKVQHVGICVEKDQGQIWVIHATSSRGVILENVTASSYWRSRLRSGRAVVR